METIARFGFFKHNVNVRGGKFMLRRFGYGLQFGFRNPGLTISCLAQRLANPSSYRQPLFPGNSLNFEIFFVTQDNLEPFRHSAFNPTLP